MATEADRIADLLGMPKLTLAAFCQALIIERSYAEAAEELGSCWPRGCCVEASVDLRDVLALDLSAAGAEFVWGKFALKPPHYQWDHAWVCLANGTIIDLTAGQFIPEQPKGSCIVVAPDHPVFACYIETERDPEWARTPNQSGANMRPELSQGFLLANKHHRITEGTTQAIDDRGSPFAVRVSDITAAAGVARNTFYELFSSKQDALEQALDRYAEDLRHAVLKATMPRDTVGLKVEAGLSALCLWLDDNPAAGRLLLFHAPAISLDLDGDIRQRFGTMFSETVGPFEEMLVGAIAAVLGRYMRTETETLRMLPDLRDLIFASLPEAREAMAGG